MIQEIYIIDDDETSVLVFRELFKNDTEYKFISVKSEQIDVALKNIPTIIIINEDAIDVDTVELCTLYTEMSCHQDVIYIIAIQTQAWHHAVKLCAIVLIIEWLQPLPRRGTFNGL